MPNLSNTNRPVLKLYSFPLSGHAHRVGLFLSLLGLSAEVINVDLRHGEQRNAKFLAMNAFGQVPVLVDGPDDEVV
ncbi:glutathione S-transferase N-terminal domain-containing protein, partial [Acinetobacter baumannii]